MAFTGLETILTSIIVALVTGGIVGAKLFFDMSQKYQTLISCELKHQVVQQADNSVERKLDRMCLKQDLQFRMLRVVILQLDLSPEKQAEILNMRAGDKR